VLNWNGWRDTLACIESLQRSEYPNLSILVVDNGSTDNSVEIIRKSFEGIEVLETHANLGFAGGNNVGILLALSRKAEFIWLLNNDTVVEPGTLQALVLCAEADPGIGAVGSVLRYWHAPEKIQAWGGGVINLWTGRSNHVEGPEELESLTYLTAASVLLRSSVLREVGMLDEGYFMYWEDADLSYRIRAAGYRLTVAPDAFLLHKENASTGRKSPRMDRYISASGIRFLLKFAYFPPLPIFILIFGRALKRFLARDWPRGLAVLAGLAGPGHDRSPRAKVRP
jgi:GT2 family glycosyltransferase